LANQSTSSSTVICWTLAIAINGSPCGLSAMELSPRQAAATARRPCLTHSWAVDQPVTSSQYPLSTYLWHPHQEYFVLCGLVGDGRRCLPPNPGVSGGPCCGWDSDSTWCTLTSLQLTVHAAVLEGEVKLRGGQPSCPACHLGSDVAFCCTSDVSQPAHCEARLAGRTANRHNFASPNHLGTSPLHQQRPTACA
jgi:hypothetical protein